MTQLAAKEIAGLDPHKFMAVIGKQELDRAPSRPPHQERGNTMANHVTERPAR
jgi:hypothetical protein